MDTGSMLKKLTVLDFIAVDLQLYLDTHPNDKEIIEKYNNTVEQADSIRAALEENGRPLYSYRSVSDDDTFNWVDNPWPWEKKFNKMLGEVCD